MRLWGVGRSASGFEDGPLLAFSLNIRLMDPNISSMESLRSEAWTAELHRACAGKGKKDS